MSLNASQPHELAIPHGREPRRWHLAPAFSPFFVAACLAAAAVWIDLGKIHSRHTADSLLPVLESIYGWEPYYWEQNRYGMLVALLAKPWANPFANLLVQNGITIWCGLVSIPLAVRYLFREPSSVALGLFAAAAFVGLTPLQIQWIYASTYNVFSTSLALGLAGLICLESPSLRRYAAAGACFAAAAWVNSAIGALLLPLVVCVAASRLLVSDLTAEQRLCAKRRLLTESAYCLAATGAAWVFQRLAHPDYHNTHLALPPPSTWWTLLRSMSATFANEANPAFWLAWSGCLLVASLILFVRGKGVCRTYAATALAVVVASAVYIVAMCILFDGRWRYAAPALVLLNTATAAAALAPLLRFVPSPLYSGAALLAACIPLQHGFPSVTSVANELKTTFHAGYVDVVAARATHVAGDYWTIWPQVFAANWRAYEAGDDQTIWGVSHRSRPTEASWKNVPRERVCVAVFAGDPHAARYLNLIGTEWAPAERRETLLIYRPR